MSADASSADLEQRARRVIRLFYGFQITFSLLLWMPIFYDYQKQMGLTDAQIFSIQAAYYYSFCFLEIPTGFLADRFGYRRCMLYGAALHVFTSLIPALWFSYGAFMSHWILLALSRSLVSGASSAYLFNYLESAGHGELYKGAEGKARAYSLVAKVAGFALCGPLMGILVSLPYLLTAASSLLAIFFASRMPRAREVPAEKTPVQERPRASEILRLLGSTPRLNLLILQGVGIFVLTRIVQVNLFQPVLKEKGFGATGFGIILALNTLFEAGGASIPGMFRRWLSDVKAVFLLTLGLAGSCLALGPSGPVGAVVWLTVFSILTGLSYPIQRQVLNAAIPDSRYRASLLSAESVVDRALCAVVAQHVGGYVAAGQTSLFLERAGGWTTLGCVLLMLLFLIARPRTARSAAQ